MYSLKEKMKEQYQIYMELMLVSRKQLLKLKKN